MLKFFKTSNPLPIMSLALILLLSGLACGSPEFEAVGSSEESGEHSGKVESTGGNAGQPSLADREDGEESATQFGLTDTYDYVRNGARLVVSYNAAANEFQGQVENTTGETLRRVRIEVHLSNGVELGPTTPVDLAPGQSVSVNLTATEQPFGTWSAHPEVGGGDTGGEHQGGAASGEHGEGSESGEHSGSSEPNEHRGG